MLLYLKEECDVVIVCVIGWLRERIYCLLLLEGLGLIFLRLIIFFVFFYDFFRNFGSLEILKGLMVFVLFFFDVDCKIEVEVVVYLVVGKLEVGM